MGPFVMYLLLSSGTLLARYSSYAIFKHALSFQRERHISSVVREFKGTWVCLYKFYANISLFFLGRKYTSSRFIQDDRTKDISRDENRFWKRNTFSIFLYVLRFFFIIIEMSLSNSLLYFKLLFPIVRFSLAQVLYFAANRFSRSSFFAWLFFKRYSSTV